MALERCRHQGHCFHRVDDGTLFVFHDQNPPGMVPVVCCWCEKAGEIEGYAKKTSKPPASSYDPEMQHGLFVPVKP